MRFIDALECGISARRSWPAWITILFIHSAFGQDRATIQAFDLLFQQVNQAQQPATGNQQTSPAQAKQDLQATFDLDDGTATSLIRAAATYSAAVAPLDSEAAGIIAAAKKQYKVASKTGAAVPPPPARLLELKANRDALVSKSISDLGTAIGPAQLQYLTYLLMSKVSVKPAN
jgi:hypothetical protein